MNTLLRCLILTLLLFAALSFYSYGNSTGLFIFILLGLLFEGAFWFGIFGKKKRNK
jgi:hypothetical protein